MPAPTYRSADDHKDHVFHKAEQAVHGEKKFFKKQGKRGKLIGLHVGHQLADKTTDVLQKHIAHKIADKLTKKKVKRSLGGEIGRHMSEHTTEINELWGQAVKFAAGVAAAGKTAKGAAKSAKTAARASKAGKLYKKMERGSKYRNIKRARLRNSSPMRAFVNDQAREATRKITVGAGTDALQRTADHHIRNAQERGWEKQRQRVQAARSPYQQRRESFSAMVCRLVEKDQQFTPSEMTAARNTYLKDKAAKKGPKPNDFTPSQMGKAKKAYGGHGLHNAHIALHRAPATTGALTNASNKSLYKVPTRTKTGVSDSVIARAANMTETVLTVLKAIPKAAEVAGNVAAGVGMAKQGGAIVKGKMADRKELKQAKREGQRKIKEDSPEGITKDAPVVLHTHGPLKNRNKPNTPSPFTKVLMREDDGKPTLKQVGKSQALRFAKANKDRVNEREAVIDALTEIAVSGTLTAASIVLPVAYKGAKKVAKTVAKAPGAIKKI